VAVLGWWLWRRRAASAYESVYDRLQMSQSRLWQGAPVTVVFPDQGPGEMGTLIVPNTVALVAGAPHPEAGRAFIDYLLREETVANLVDAGWFQVTLRQVEATAPCLQTSGKRGMDVPLADIAVAMETAKADMTDIFIVP
ncbi:MAG: hypothetical protein ACE5EL_08960, partial [Anaerolineae bacterium]